MGQPLLGVGSRRFVLLFGEDHGWAEGANHGYLTCRRLPSRRHPQAGGASNRGLSPSHFAGEWGWALHRQPFWMNLAWSYQQTKEEKYAEGFTKQLLDWIRKNPRDPRFEYDW